MANKSTLGKATAGQSTTPNPPATANDQTGKFATPKTIKGKSTRPFCNHVYRDGATCKLRAIDGGDGKCVNHVPAETKITEQEAITLSGWLESLTPAERLIWYVRASGWYTAKEQAKELAITKQ